jgi:hypothetical protein
LQIYRKPGNRTSNCERMDTTSLIRHVPGQGNHGGASLRFRISSA